MKLPTPPNDMTLAKLQNAITGLADSIGSQGYREAKELLDNDDMYLLECARHLHAITEMRRVHKCADEIQFAIHSIGVHSDFMTEDEREKLIEAHILLKNISMRIGEFCDAA